MKNTIIILFLFCYSFGYSYTTPVSMKINEKYYENWITLQFEHVFDKIYAAIIEDKAEVYSDSQLNVRLTKEIISKKMSFERLLQIPDDPTDPFGASQDTVVRFKIKSTEISYKTKYFFRGTKLESIGMYVYEYPLTGQAVLSKDPVFYVKLKDISFMFDEEEKFMLYTLTKYHNENYRNIIIEESNFKKISESIYRNMESKIWKATVNFKTLVYASDSLVRKHTYEDVENLLSDYKITFVPDDSKDSFGSGHDSVMKIKDSRENIDSDTSWLRDMFLFWGPKKSGEIKLIAAAPSTNKTISGVYIGEIPVGCIKVDDTKYIYSKDEERLFNYIANHALYLNVDYRDVNYKIDFDHTRQPPFSFR